MNSEKVNYLTCNHDHYGEHDHGESSQTEEIIESRVLEETDKTAIIDEQRCEHQNDGQ